MVYLTKEFVLEGSTPKKEKVHSLFLNSFFFFFWVVELQKSLFGDYTIHTFHSNLQTLQIHLYSLHPLCAFCRLIHKTIKIPFVHLYVESLRIANSIGTYNFCSFCVCLIMCLIVLKTVGGKFYVWMLRKQWGKGKNMEFSS